MDNKVGIRRRTIATGAAWAVPAVVIAAPAAQAAVSGEVVCIPSQEICGEYAGSACKHPGNPKYYHFTFCFTNTGDAPATVVFTKMVVNGQTAPRLVPAPVRDIRPGSVVVPADGVEHCYYVDGGPFPDSAQGTGSLTITVNGVQAVIPITASDFPPCGTGGDPNNNPKDDPPPGGHNPTGP